MYIITAFSLILLLFTIKTLLPYLRYHWIVFEVLSTCNFLRSTFFTNKLTYTTFSDCVFIRIFPVSCTTLHLSLRCVFKQLQPSLVMSQHLQDCSARQPLRSPGCAPRIPIWIIILPSPPSIYESKCIASNHSPNVTFGVWSIYTIFRESHFSICSCNFIHNFLM